MHSSTSIFYFFPTLFLSWLLIVQSTPLENVEEVQAVAGLRGTPVPLYRYWNAQAGDHLYTINIDELGPSGKGGFVSEGITGKCFPIIDPNTVAFLRYFNSGIKDHFYTTNFGEAGCGRNGYVIEGITCYIYVQSNPGTVPLYRYFNQQIGDHLYTVDFNELGPQGKGGYVYEGIAGYILPA